MTSPPTDARWRLSPRELSLILLFWMSLPTLSAINRLLDPPGYGFRVMSPAGPIAMGYLEALLWAVCTPLIFWLSSRFNPDRRRWLVSAPLLLLIGLGIAIAVSMILDFARHEIFEVASRRGGRAMFSPMRELGRLHFLNQLTVYIGVLAAGFAREYFVRDQVNERQAVELQAQAARLEAQLAGARLDALRMQINPHFLFNTLHAVSALVERDPAGVRKMIARLSELLRHTIDSQAADEVPLRDELAFLRRYIDIMEIRFQGRLRVRIDAGDDTLEALVPDLILQPIVENALEHGASRVEGIGEIVIGARRDVSDNGDRVVLSVRDNGPGLSGTPESGVGLANTRARLAQLYGDAGELTLSPAPEGGTIATITIPFHTAGDLRTTGELDA
jgi:two-component system, LytTR family, sensor kinase